MSYCKIRFTSRNGSTAGLVVPSEKARTASVGELSRMYPIHEAHKMERLEVSPEYPTFEDAFRHSFGD